MACPLAARYGLMVQLAPTCVAARTRTAVGQVPGGYVPIPLTLGWRQGDRNSDTHSRQVMSWHHLDRLDGVERVTALPVVVEQEVGRLWLLLVHLGQHPLDRVPVDVEGQLDVLAHQGLSVLH